MPGQNNSKYRDWAPLGLHLFSFFKFSFQDTDPFKSKENLFSSSETGDLFFFYFNFYLFLHNFEVLHDTTNIRSIQLFKVCSCIGAVLYTKSGKHWWRNGDARLQCVPGSIPRPGVIYALSLLLVLFSALRFFSPGTPVSPSPQKPTFPSWNAWAFLNKFLWTPWCTVGKQIAYLHIYIQLHIYVRVRVRALARGIVLCSWARHLTLTVPLSTQVYKWVPANLMLGGNPAMN